MATVTGFVVVVAFAGILGGEPNVSVLTDGEVYATEEACLEQKDVLQKKIDNFQDTKDRILQAYGLSCAKVDFVKRKQTYKPDA